MEIVTNGRGGGEDTKDHGLRRKNVFEKATRRTAITDGKDDGGPHLWRSDLQLLNEAGLNIGGSGGEILAIYVEKLSRWEVYSRGTKEGE